ncbi:MAG: endonuclease V [Thermoplasmataceae archaeon]
MQVNPEVIPHLHSYDLYSYFYGLVTQIPEGKISTYGDLAVALGDIAAARSCAYMISICRDCNEIPIHRVIRSDGYIWKYTRYLGQSEKIRMLHSEGIDTNGSQVVDFEKLRHKEFVSIKPLEIMRNVQDKISKKVDVSGSYDDDAAIGAVDVSYDDGFGYGSFVWRDSDGLHTRNAVLPVRFPYIPGYLAFREFRFIETLCRDFKGILLIDGNGYLHPRRAGLASYAGVMLGIRTIGIAKSLLMGQIIGNYVYIDSERVAYASGRRFIVSAGHGISLDNAVEFLNKAFQGRYPDLLRIAHKNTVDLRVNQQFTRTLGD